MGSPAKKPAPGTAGLKLVRPDEAFDQMPEWARGIAQALLTAMRERDPYTYGHCLRVARNARLLARAAGLSDQEQQIIEYASLFHDLGKIAIPDRILLKPGRLDQKEEAIMKAHPEKSVEIIQPLSSVPFFRSTIPGIQSHHERIDGKGYPDRLKGEDIPFEARLIVIVDTYDAMTTTRPYRKGLDKEIAYKELKTFSGRQFDPHLVKIFLESHAKWKDYEEEITEEFVASHFRRAA